MRISEWFRRVLLRSKAPAETLASQLKGLDEQQLKTVIDCVQKELRRRYPVEGSNGSSSRPPNGSRHHIVPRSRRPAQRGGEPRPWPDIMDALRSGSSDRRKPREESRAWLTDELLLSVLDDQK